MSDIGRRGTIVRALDNCPTTTLVLGITALVTVAQFVWPQILEAFRRTPDALQNGEWWRLFSPLFVHAYGWPHLLFNLVWISAIGLAVERRFGHFLWLLFYFVPGVVGEFAGLVWEPHGAGASLGGSGLLGAFAVWLLLHRPRDRWWGILIILGGTLLTLLRDLHGPSILAGVALGTLILMRFGASPPGSARH
jgi:membrane associated rhomboid family serine protease